MTLPCERTRALIGVKQFLARLASAYAPGGIKNVPKVVREEARRLLRHYPTPMDVLLPEHWDQQTVDAYYDDLAKTWGHVTNDAVPADKCRS
jgi:hypothetical protein